MILQNLQTGMIIFSLSDAVSVALFHERQLNERFRREGQCNRAEYKDAD